MLEEANAQDLRLILQAAGVRKWRIRNAVVKALHNNTLKQKTKGSAVLVPGEQTIEQFMGEFIAKHKTSYSKVDVSLLPPSSRKILFTLNSEPSPKDTQLKNNSDTK